MGNFYRTYSEMIYLWLDKNQINSTSLLNSVLKKIYGHNDIINLHGGIYDPISMRVLGDHYSTSFFLALKVLKEKNSSSEMTEDSILSALNFIKKYSFRFPYGNWQIHRDFNNLALALTLTYVNDKYKPIFYKKTKLLVPQRNRAGNWVGMRAVTYTILSKVHTRNFIYSLMSKHYIKMFLRYIDKDYCFHDLVKESYPVQYHVYSSSLMYLLYMHTGTQKFKEIFLKSVDYTIQHISFQGDFNYIGRGQKQIFGYGVFYFTMNAAYSITKDKKYLSYLSKNEKFLKNTKQEVKHLCLLQNGLKDERENGWYDYHHSTVYNAFFAFYINYSDYLFGDKLSSYENKEEINLNHNENLFVEFETSSIMKNKMWMVQFGTGGNKYETDLGFSPNLISNTAVEIFSSPAGPTENKYGKNFLYKNLSKYNIFSPIIEIERKVWPYFYKMSNEFIDNKLIISSVNDEFSVYREVCIENDYLIVKDKIIRHKLGIIGRIFNLSLRHDLLLDFKKNKIFLPQCIITVDGIDQLTHIENYAKFASGQMDLFYFENEIQFETNIVTTFKYLSN